MTRPALPNVRWYPGRSVLQSSPNLGVRILCPRCSGLFTGQRYAGLSDLPHSRQQLLRRDVINPQNGHILCERNPRSTGLSAASSFLNESLKKASFLPIRMRERRKLGSIYSTLHSLSLNAGWPVTGPSSDSQNSFALGTPASLG